MSKNNIHSDAAERIPHSSRRSFLSWLGGVTALGLSGGLAGLPAAHAAVASPGALPKLGTATTAGAASVALPAIPVHKGGQTLLDTLTLDTFTPHLNTSFVFLPTSLDEAPVAAAAEEAVEVAAEPPAPVILELVEAKVRKSRQEIKVTDAFMLVFRGPANQPLPQETYEVRHDGIGTFPLFIVPIGQDDNGLYYQAIFNRLIQA